MKTFLSQLSLLYFSIEKELPKLIVYFGTDRGSYFSLRPPQLTHNKYPEIAYVDSKLVAVDKDQLHYNIWLIDLSVLCEIADYYLKLKKGNKKMKRK